MPLTQPPLEIYIVEGNGNFGRRRYNMFVSRLLIRQRRYLMIIIFICYDKRQHAKMRNRKLNTIIQP